MDGNETQALVVRTDPEYQGLVMHCSPAEAKRRMQELKAFVREAMVKDVDFGIIPGTDKPTLLQPGAQKLCEMYGLAVDFKIEEKQEDWEKGFFYYRVKCSLTDRRSGAEVGVGYGSCNSKEKRYAARWVPESEVPGWLDKTKLAKRSAFSWLFKSDLPAGLNIATLPTQKKTSKKGGEYLVYGCQVDQYQVPNEDIYSLVNTILKMSCKRSHVHATLAVTRSGGVFDQDKEDLPRDVFGEADERRSWERVDEVEDPDGSEKAPPETPEAACERLLRDLEAAATGAEADAVAKREDVAKLPDALKQKFGAAYKARKAALRIAWWVGLVKAADTDEKREKVRADFAARNGWTDTDRAAVEAAMKEHWPAAEPKPEEPKFDKEVVDFWSAKYRGCKSKEAFGEVDTEVPDSIGALEYNAISDVRREVLAKLGPAK